MMSCRFRSGRRTGHKTRLDWGVICFQKALRMVSRRCRPCLRNGSRLLDSIPVRHNLGLISLCFFLTPCLVEPSVRTSREALPATCRAAASMATSWLRVLKLQAAITLSIQTATCLRPNEKTCFASWRSTRVTPGSQLMSLSWTVTSACRRALICPALRLER